MEQSLPANVETYLQDLQNNNAIIRRDAVETLGKLTTSHKRIVSALIAVAESDRKMYVRIAASESLLAPVHQAVIQQYPELAAKVAKIQPAPQRESEAQIAMSASSTYAPSTYAASSYAALRGIASLCTGLGWLIVGLAGLGAITGLVTITKHDGFALGLAIVITSVAVGGFFFIVLRVIAEGISVLLDIEANTRQAAINTQRTASILEQRQKVEKAA